MRVRLVWGYPLWKAFVASNVTARYILTNKRIPTIAREREIERERSTHFRFFTDWCLAVSVWRAHNRSSLKRPNAFSEPQITRHSLHTHLRMSEQRWKHSSGVCRVEWINLKNKFLNIGFLIMSTGSLFWDTHWTSVDFAKQYYKKVQQTVFVFLLCSKIDVQQNVIRNGPP